MELGVEQLASLLVRSRLMGPDDGKSVQERWRLEAGPSANQPSAFLRWLITNQYLTEYQAGLLARGHTDDYFLGQYKILDRLGRGRMAGVYKALHRLGQLVAIKVLPPSRAKNPQLLGRFQRESKLAQRLKHPNVVRAFQIGEEKSLHFLVMEYLDGDTLEDVLGRRRTMPPHEAVRLVHQALLGLEHIHEQGLVHRDLKPANLMLVPPPSKEGWSTLKSNVKILDIGLARELFDENATLAQDQAELTGEGVLLGTPDYLAPEQARDPRTIDIRADIYSLGCVLYHMLSGQPPFPDKNLLNQMVRHATETAKPLRDFNPQIPEGLEQIVQWMMAKKPEHRYLTPGRAAQALEMFLMAGEATASAEDSPAMSNYLSWLETSEKGAGSTLAYESLPSLPQLPGATNSADVSVPASPPITLAQLPSSNPPAVPTSVPSVTPVDSPRGWTPETIDVELTPIHPPAPRTAARDVAMLFAGAAITLGLAFAAALVATVIVMVTG